MRLIKKIKNKKNTIRKHFYTDSNGELLDLSSTIKDFNGGTYDISSIIKDIIKNPNKLSSIIKYISENPPELSSLIKQLAAAFRSSYRTLLYGVSAEITAGSYDEGQFIKRMVELAPTNLSNEEKAKEVTNVLVEYALHSKSMLEDMRQTYENITKSDLFKYTGKTNSSVLKSSYPELEPNISYVIIYLDDNEQVHIIDENKIIPYNLCGTLEHMFRVEGGYENMKKFFGIQSIYDSASLSTQGGKSNRSRNRRLFFSESSGNVDGLVESAFDLGAGLLTIISYTFYKGGRFVISAKGKQISGFVALLFCLLVSAGFYQNSAFLNKNESTKVDNNEFRNNIQKVSKYIVDSFDLKSEEEDIVDDKIDETVFNLVFDDRIFKMLANQEKSTDSFYSRVSLDLFLLLLYLAGLTSIKLFPMISKSQVMFRYKDILINYIKFIRLSFLNLLYKDYDEKLIPIMKDFYVNLKIEQ